GPIPATPHLHGGFVPPEIDGGPDSWFLSDGSKVGTGYYSKDGNAPKNYCIYRYPNDQELGLIWFHDHTLGATRLNVYAGLAGAYVVQDPNAVPANLPPLFPLVIQDRMFDTNGELFFPSASNGGILSALNPQHPYWVPEFVGDTIVVNGKSWPYMNVEPRRYTFPIINGSNARTYGLSFIDQVSKNKGPSLWVIATDGGFLDTPVELNPNAKSNNELILQPGERYWVIVDFTNFKAGTIGPNGAAYSGKWLLRNTAKTPYPGGATPNGNTVGRIMEFRIGALTAPDTSLDPSLMAPLRAPMVRLPGTLADGNSVITRQLTLNEIMGMPVTTTDPVTGTTVAYPGGPLEILVNNTKWNGDYITGVESMMWTKDKRPDFTLDDNGINSLSEMPKEGDTEIWEIVNTTADAHPIHLHLAQFQLLSRQSYNTNKYVKAYAASFPAGFDFTAGMDGMGANVGPGVFVPAFGPPLNYTTG
ncbi:MAG: multicopper oxidase family protein, partial [Anaerolineae bacterium]